MPIQKFIDEYYTTDGKLFRKGEDDQLGWLCNDRYLMFDHEGSKYLVHRAIFLLTYGYLPDLVDHVDQNKLNNNPSNLRELNKRLNSFNSKIRGDNSSGYKGISWLKSNQKWEVYIHRMGKKISGGYFKELDAAVAARQKLEKEFVNYASIH